MGTKSTHIRREKSQGFILPTIIVLGLAIMIASVTVLQTIVRSSNSLNSQYFTKIAKESAEAGLIQGAHCGAVAVVSGILTPASHPKCAPGGGYSPTAPATFLLAQDNWVATYSVTMADSSLGPTVASKGEVYVYRNSSRSGTAVAHYEKIINTVLTTSSAAGAVTASPSRAITKVASGGGHSCALSAGQVYCWGNNNRGQLGTGSYTSSGDPLLIQQPWQGTLGVNAKVTDVEVGAESSCAVVEPENTPNKNEVYCWGLNDVGQLGNGNSGVHTSPVPLRVQGLADKYIVELSTGTNVTSPSCVLTDETSGVNAYCWGGNWSGQIGNNASTGFGGGVFAASRVQDPNNVLAGKRFVSISANNHSTCGAMDTGQVYCWGWSVPAGWPCNASIDMLGRGTSSACLLWNAPDEPISASYFNGPVTKLAAGGYTTCAISGGKAYCWGGDGEASGHYVGGALGRNATGHTTRPYAVVGMPSGQEVTDIDIDSDTGCAVVGGQLYCWGRNDVGQLGRGHKNLVNSNRRAERITAVFSDKVVTSIGTGFRHDCAVASGTVYCWGGDTAKLLIGNPSGTDASGESLVPIKTSNSALESAFPASSVSAGSNHTCATVSDRVFCWGRNHRGQLGNGDVVSRGVPEQVPGMLGSKKIGKVSAGNDFTCASVTEADESDRVYCWGDNTTGQLGQNPATLTYATVPYLIAGFPAEMKVTDLSAGDGYACAAITTSSTTTTGAYCWGRNETRQLGNGSSAAQHIMATKVTSSLMAGSIMSISAGRYSTCAVRAENGWLYCWGQNSQGVLGTGTTNTASIQNTPIRVNGGAIGTKRVQSVAVSKSSYAGIDPSNGPFACAVLQAQQNVVCWGAGGLGQLGDGTVHPYLPPLSLPYENRPRDAVSGALDNQSVMQLSVGSRHGCSLSMNTSVVCWGAGAAGQIGNNTGGILSLIQAPSRINTYGDLRTMAGVNRYVTTVSAGDSHTCAVADSALYCWGDSSYGKLGLGSVGTGGMTRVPTQVASYNTVNGAREQTGIRY